MRDAGTPYIARVVPYTHSIHIEWLPCEGVREYTLLLAPRGETPRQVAKTEKTHYDFEGLETDRDYCFCVTCEAGQSRLRLARTGERDGTDGVTVNYLHPEDDAYAFSGRYLCSPSMVRLPDGALVASMDVFEANRPQNLTLLFRSEDGGQSWHYACELFPCFWGKLFVHKGRLYMLAVSTEYGDLLIGASDDGGYSFTQPSVLFRGACHSGASGIHKNPQPVV